MLVLRIATIVFAVIALRGIRWAYVTYIILGLLYFPMQAGFHLHAPACQLGISVGLVLFSLRNWAHIVLFAIFSVMTMAQFRTRVRSTFAWAALIVVTMGAMVEIAQGATGIHNCKLRDVVPDAAGALLGMALVVAWTRTSASFRFAGS